MLPVSCCAERLRANRTIDRGKPQLEGWETRIQHSYRSLNTRQLDTYGVHIDQNCRCWCKVFVFNCPGQGHFFGAHSPEKAPSIVLRELIPVKQKNLSGCTSGKWLLWRTGIFF